jgi:hypothetical protein
MLAAINPVALPALRIAATFFLLINLLGGRTSFLIAIASLTEIRMWTTTFRPFASCGSRSLCSLGWV